MPELNDEPTDYSHLISIIADIREKTGVGAKPMLDELADAIAERIGTKSAQAYQVIGDLLARCNAFDTDEGERALDYFVDELAVDEEFLPWPRDDLVSAHPAEPVSGDAQDIANRLRSYFSEPGDARRLALNAAMMVEYLNAKRPAVEPVAVKGDADHLTRPIIGIENRTAQEVFDIMSDRIRSALVSTPAPTHRHKKRGTKYVLIGFGKMQAEKWIDLDNDNEHKVDMREVAIYRSVDDGSMWVRPRGEFEDGRFEALASITGGAK